MNKILKIVIIVIIILIALVAIFHKDIVKLYFTPQEPAGEIKSFNQDSPADIQEIEVIADNLNIPWEIVFLPNGDILATERSGTLKNISKDIDFEIEGINHFGEGGLLGMALHPNFAENNYIYLYFTSNTDNRVNRYTLDNDNLVFDRTIINQIPLSRFHNGGRIKFGPDNYLYITTGDAQNTDLAQDLNSLAGKILRIKDDGSIPEDNPFNDEIYSYGHRNPQGITWDDNGEMWATEHGPVSQDELNIISKGYNYGWPTISGDGRESSMESPYMHSGDNYTWAPSGMLFYQDYIFFAGLRGQSIYKVDTKKHLSEPAIYLNEEFGRLRNISLGPDEMFYILTNNNDGRGDKNENDDKILKINPLLFLE